MKAFFKKLISGRQKASQGLTQNKILLKNIEQLKESSPDVSAQKQPSKKTGKKVKSNSYQAIRQEWQAIILQNQKNIEQLYERGKIKDWAECCTKMENDFSFEDEIYSLLLNWLEDIDWSDSAEATLLFKYIELISSNDYKLNGRVLLKYHARLLANINTLIDTPDFKITESFRGGNLGELIGNLIELYFYHSISSFSHGYVEQFDIDKQEVAEVIPRFIQKFPNNCGNLVFYILENNTKHLVEDYASLLHFFITEKIESNYDLASDLFGTYQKPSDLPYKNSATILKKTLEQSTLSEEGISYLIDDVLLSQLSINNKEKQIQTRRNHLESLKGFFDDQVIVKKQSELSDFINDFDTLYAKNWNSAVKRVAVSRPIYKSIELVINTFPNHEKTTVLQTLINEAHEYKNKPKLYDLNQKPQVVFKDLHFKYLVIEALMYQQEILKPKFDVRELAKEYTKREIDVENDGYEPIPEVKKYFKNLDIPADLLPKVTELYQDSGLGGGSEFIYELYPFWDPGCGDEVFKVSNKAIDDLDLLPNLKKIVGLENSKPSKKLVEALEGRGICLEDEDV